MACLFGLVILERNTIRAFWWAWRIGHTDDSALQAYYLASLAAVGDRASPAVRCLAASDRPETRACAVVALAKLPRRAGVPGLQTLLHDPDPTIIEFAAVSLAFLALDNPDDPQAETGLLQAARSTSSPTAVGAAAGLARLASAASTDTLCELAARHADPWVRAQAVESLAAQLMAARATRAPWSASTSLPAALRDATSVRPPSSSPPTVPSCDSVAVLVAALADRGAFAARLSLERQIASASVAAGRPAAGVSLAPSDAIVTSRTVAEIAAAHLERLVGRPIDPSAGLSPVESAKLAAEIRHAPDANSDQ
jgi:hypothetical protein